jgi:putative DeoR family transcriptional regulator (stage III sporulation protein D)
MLGQYIAEHESTVRQTAAVFGISKSTVHKDVTEKLMKENPGLYKSVLSVLCKNKAERHLRGGQATKLKYELLKDLSSSSVNDGG